jgi:hypothetical protein
MQSPQVPLVVSKLLAFHDIVHDYRAISIAGLRFVFRKPGTQLVTPPPLSGSTPLVRRTFPRSGMLSLYVARSLLGQLTLLAGRAVVAFLPSAPVVPNKRVRPLDRGSAAGQ